MSDVACGRRMGGCPNRFEAAHLVDLNIGFGLNCYAGEEEGRVIVVEV